MLLGNPVLRSPFRLPESKPELVELLRNAEANGIDVQTVVDYERTLRGGTNDPVITTEANDETKDNLGKLGTQASIACLRDR